MLKTIVAIVAIVAIEWFPNILQILLLLSSIQSCSVWFGFGWNRNIEIGKEEKKFRFGFR